VNVLVFLLVIINMHGVNIVFYSFKKLANFFKTIKVLLNSECVGIFTSDNKHVRCE
jgi:hypothetical protein